MYPASSSWVMVDVARKSGMDGNTSTVFPVGKKGYAKVRGMKRFPFSQQVLLWFGDRHLALGKAAEKRKGQ